MCFLDTAELITISALGACGMYILSLVSYFVLRKKEPEMPRPYKAPLYPLLPGVALILGIVACGSVCFSEPYLALGVLGFGIVLGIGYHLKQRKI